MRQTDVYNGGVFAEDYLSMNNGNVYFLDPQNGNDGNSGKSITQAFKTLPYAYSKLTANQHDRLYYIAGPGKCNLTAPFVWAKNVPFHPCGKRARKINPMTGIKRTVKS